MGKKDSEVLIMPFRRTVALYISIINRIRLNKARTFVYWPKRKDRRVLG